MTDKLMIWLYLAVAMLSIVASIILFRLLMKEAKEKIKAATSPVKKQRIKPVCIEPVGVLEDDSIYESVIPISKVKPAKYRGGSSAGQYLEHDLSRPGIAAISTISFELETKYSLGLRR